MRFFCFPVAFVGWVVAFGAWVGMTLPLFAQSRSDSLTTYCNPLDLATLKFLSRDNGRTPMQWSDSTHVGFTSGTPWLPVNENYPEVNVEAEEDDPESCLNYFRKMVKLRKDHPIFVYGDYQLLLPDHKQIYAYTRTGKDERVLVLLNFSAEPARAQIPFSVPTGEVMINNYESVALDEQQVTLEPYQAVIVSLEQ